MHSIHDILTFYLYISVWSVSALVIDTILKKIFGSNKTALLQDSKTGVRKKFVGFVLFQAAIFSAIIFCEYCFYILLILLTLIAAVEFAVQIKKSSLPLHRKILLSIVILILLILLPLCFIRLSYVIDGTKLLYIFLILAIADAYSQVVGTNFGGPFLIPSISPRKTISGLIGGFFFAFIAATTYFLLFLSGEMTLLNAVTIMITVFICATAGDLLVSAIKRQLRIKDFSNILGPQGGMLDRLDSMILLSPVIYIIFTFLIENRGNL